MTTVCRWDAEAHEYLTPDGDVCKRDDYGDPTRHCTARRTCSLHVGHGELTCARCIARTRQDVRTIVVRYAEVMPEAIVKGVNSEAMSLAGPAADVEAWSWHKVSAKQGRIWHASLVEDDDEHHPLTVLGTWVRMLAEDYGLDCPSLDVVTAAAFLDRILHRVAQDDGQDFPLMAREIRKCRSHLESVLSDSMAPERGAPCPDCRDLGKFVRLQREYPHWCNSPTCERFHTETEDADKWVCPRNAAHWWTAEGYAEYERERKGA